MDDSNLTKAINIVEDVIQAWADYENSDHVTAGTRRDEFYKQKLALINLVAAAMPTKGMDVNSPEAAIWSENMRMKSENDHLRKVLLTAEIALDGAECVIDADCDVDQFNRVQDARKLVNGTLANVTNRAAAPNA